MSFVRPERTWHLWRRRVRRLDLTLLRKRRRVRSIKKQKTAMLKQKSVDFSILNSLKMEMFCKNTILNVSVL